MRFYTKQHKFYCGIDLHTKKMYLCILDDKAVTVRNIADLAKSSHKILFEDFKEILA